MQKRQKEKSEKFRNLTGKEFEEATKEYFDSSNVLLYYKQLKKKLSNFKPETIEDLYERNYLSKLNDLETNLNFANKLIEPGSYKDEKIHDFEQEIETLKKKNMKKMDLFLN